jgi:Flp pilus assembly protein TadD
MFKPFSQLFYMRLVLTCSLALACLAWPSTAQGVWAQVETKTSQAQAKDAEKAFDQGHYAEALDLFQAALKTEPNRIYWLRLMAESYQYLGRFAEAEAVLTAALERYPQEALLLEGMGWLKLFQKDFKAAESWLRKAWLQEPDGFWIQLNLAYALLFQGKEAEAFALLCQLVRSPEGPSLGTAMKKDFAKLAKFKITHPDSDTLTELFTSRCGLGLVLPEACTPKPADSKTTRP